MDEPYLLAAARYVELNPVRAGLVDPRQRLALEQARAHLSGRDDRLVRVAPLLAMVANWRGLLRQCYSQKKNWESCGNTFAPGVRWGTRRFWNVWRTWSAVS